MEIIKADKEAKYYWLDSDLAKDWIEYLRTSRYKYIVIAKA